MQCNEVHPKCQNCTRREIECDFERLLTPDSSNAADGPLPTDHVHQSAPPSSSYGHLQPPIDPLLYPDLISTKRTTDLDVSDLELMHHWSAELSVSLASQPTPEARALWQTHAVALGFKHEFLLRGILAASALHLSYLHPEYKQSYDLKASTHQGLALTLFQETLSHVDESNCQALFAFSCLLVIIAFASSSKKDASDLQTDVLHWFHLLRGGNSVLTMHRETLANSLFSSLLNEMKHTENTSAHKVKDADRIIGLIKVCCLSEHDAEVSQAYALAIHDLLSTFIQASMLRNRGEASLLASFVWPVNLSPKYLELLTEQQPEALVILAHYCVLIQWCDEDQEWFVAGWARFMLDTIKASLPEDWLPSIAWPDNTIR